MCIDKISLPIDKIKPSYVYLALKCSSGRIDFVQVRRNWHAHNFPVPPRIKLWFYSFET